jgi:hypothetical protein
MRCAKKEQPAEERSDKSAADRREASGLLGYDWWRTEGARKKGRLGTRLGGVAAH